MAGLVQQLDTYSKIGIPKLHHHATFEYEDEVEEGEVKNSRFGSPNQCMKIEFHAGSKSCLCSQYWFSERVKKALEHALCSEGKLSLTLGRPDCCLKSF